MFDIKAWDLERKEFLDVEDMVFTVDGVYENPRDFEDGFSLKSIKIIKSTKLFDRHGVEIFESSVLADKIGQYYYVKDDWICIQSMVRRDFLEIVGDIYENPELLEGGS